MGSQRTSENNQQRINIRHAAGNSQQAVTNGQQSANSSQRPANNGQYSANNSQHPVADDKSMILARFIRLCSAVLASPMPHETSALIVNRISELVRVDRAVLVRLNGKYAITAVSGGGTAAQDSSFADAVEAVRNEYGDKQDPMLVPSENGTGQGKSRKSPLGSCLPLQKAQQAMGGTTILWLPLWLNRDGKVPPDYALWLERWHGRLWEKADVDLLYHTALFLGHGLVGQRVAKIQSKNRFLRLIAVLILLVMLIFPVASSVTAPVRVVPDRPHHIFAPMDGILKNLLVQPGQWVEKGTTLFRYDSRVLDKRLDEAYRNVAVAKAKLARLQGAAHRDPLSRSELPIQQLEVERAEADVAFYAKQQARAEVKTGKAGVIVLDDPDALIGASLQTGQIVLSVADPSSTKLRIMVPASDVGILKKGARVGIRLDSNPLRSVPASIIRIGFDIKLAENQVPSVLAEAIWSEKQPEVQPGQKGSAKVFGSTTYLGLQLLRKPLVKLRTLTGL
ncbi:MAG: HlyD family efflux transporter periplasmic adaptor subunit [Desulfobacteraceae bacterium]|nr:HlyD family efflux transporter periplasmic adaptor subunit [Desulfobacteraceae bacterium]